VSCGWVRSRSLLHGAQQRQESVGWQACTDKGISAGGKGRLLHFGPDAHDGQHRPWLKFVQVSQQIRHGLAGQIPI
jgi:hypothetical protein